MILRRHLNWESLTYMVGLSASLLLVVVIYRLTLYLGDVANGRLVLEALFWILLYRLPHFVETLLPLALFLGILLPMARLSEEGSLVFLPTVGVGMWRLAAWLAPTIAIAAVALAALSFWLTPKGIAQAHEILNGPKGSSVLSSLVPGRFQLFGQRRAASYFEDHDESGESMQRLLVVRLDDGGGEWVALAEQARVRWHDGQHWLDMQGGHHYIGVPGRGDYRQIDFSRHRQIVQAEQRAGERTLSVQAVPSAELWRSDRANHAAHWHWRAGMPMMALALGLCAVGLGRFQPLRSRQYLPILLALAIYIAYWVMLTSVRALAVNDSVSPWMMWLVHAVVVALGCGLLSRGGFAAALRLLRARATR